MGVGAVLLALPLTVAHAQSADEADDSTASGGVVASEPVTDAVPERTAPERSAPEGTLANSTVSEGTLSNSAVSEGAVSEGAASEGAASEGAVSEGAVSEGAVSEGAVSEGAVSETSRSSTSRAREPGEDPSIEEREAPDYDQRDDRRATAGEVALWVPRIVFFPLYLVTEFVLRRPLGFLISNAEEKEIPERVVQFFTFGPSNNVALAPTFSFDFGFRPSVGLYFRYNDFLHPNHALRAGASFGGLRWITGSLAYRIEPANSDSTFQVTLAAVKRPDGLYFGIGSEVNEDLRSRYNWVGYDAGTSLIQRLWRQSEVRIDLGVRHRHFGDNIVDGAFSMEERAFAGQLELPTGYKEGYTAIKQGMQLSLDTRRARPEAGSGVRLTVAYDFGVDLANGPEAALWVTWASALGFYFDLTGDQHVISLTASLIAAETLSGEVPFTELPNLSGNGPMRGFIGRFLTGDSGASVVLRYDWPVWIWLDGTIHVAVGNVYDGRFSGLSAGNSRLSAGIGLAAVDQRDHFFEFLVGFGTDTFENGPDIESVRILFGGTREF